MFCRGLTFGLRRINLSSQFSSCSRRSPKPSVFLLPPPSRISLSSHSSASCSRRSPKPSVFLLPPPSRISLSSHSSASCSRRSPKPSVFLLPPPSRISLSSHCSASRPGMELQEVLQILETLAPLSLAESWDNVGLLVEPSVPRPIRTVLLTNDLTDGVMAEAESVGADLLVSYHPPLFRPIKRLAQGDWKQRLAVRAVEAGLAVFSPHTSWDAVRGGVNDWLVGGLGRGQVSVLVQASSSSGPSHRLEFHMRNEEELKVVMEELKVEGSGIIHSSSHRSEVGGLHVSVTCSDSALTSCVQTLLGHSALSSSLTVSKLEKVPLPGHGQGRRSVLEEPVSVAEAVDKMKTHLGLRHLRLALGNGHTLESRVVSVAVCAGSGASVLDGVKADLYVTGEMSHHEVLDAVSRGTSVILSEHSNSERGFLSVFRERLAVRLPDTVTVLLSQADRDPLQVV